MDELEEEDTIMTKPADTLSLVGHEGQVYACDWHPTTSMLVTSASDGSARIWNIPEKPSLPVSEPIVLQHDMDGSRKDDVTHVAWHVRISCVYF